MTACTTETIRISIPRLPKRRPNKGGEESYRWADWLHAMRTWSKLVVVDGKLERVRDMPILGAPCRVNAKVRFHPKDSDGLIPIGTWREGIKEALVRSSIATNIVSMEIRYEYAKACNMGTDIEIVPLT